MGLSEENQKKWIERWVHLGLEAYEKVLQDGTDGPFSHGGESAGARGRMSGDPGCEC